MKSAKIKIKIQEDKYAYVQSDVFARSAFDHDVDLDDFIASMDNFCCNSVSSREQVSEWRDLCITQFTEFMIGAAPRHNKYKK